MVWATYFAGDGADAISALAIAPDGNLVIAGTTTSKNLLPNLGGYRTTPASLFIAKLSADGKALLAATYFGGDAADTVVALRLDRGGNVYVAGDAYSDPFPTSPGAYQRARGAGPPPPGFAPGFCPCTDQFAAKFDPQLSRLLFSTLIGTSVLERTDDLALGPDGSLYVSGTRGPWGGQGPGPTAPMVTRLTQDATAVIYSTEIRSFPGAGPVVVDSEGSAYVASYTPRWPIAGPDSSTWKVSPQGAVLWGQPVRGTVTSMALNSRGEIVVTGMALDLWLRPTAGAPRPCVSYRAFRPVAAYVARWNTSSRIVTFAGFLNAKQAWLAGPDQVVAESAYVGFPQFSLQPAGNPPAGTVTCVANAAGYDNTAIAPGEILTIFGTQIGPSREFTAELDANGNVTRQLGGMTVSIEGLRAPILYAAPGQINLVAPFAIPTEGAVRLEIRRDGSLVRAFDQPVSGTHAALFTTDGSRVGPLAALNQDGSINSASNPASPGSVVSVFATGLGAMTPPAVDGGAPSAPISRPVAEFSIEVVGRASSSPASIEYIGNAPGLIQGAVQINFRIPQSITPADGVITVFLRPGTDSGTVAVR